MDMPSVNMQEIVDNVLDLVPGNHIPPALSYKMSRIMIDLALVRGYIGGIKDVLGPAIARALKGEHEALERVYDILMLIETEGTPSRYE